MDKIRIAINGYGNLGRGVEMAAQQAADLEVVGVYTRRDPASLETKNTPAFALADLETHARAGQIDVVVNCGGSATDLAEQTPAVTAFANVVDSFDTHAKIPAHFAAVDAAARESGHVALISAGWDPGLFSLLRVLGLATLPNGETTTFWGRGVSQGHSDALRRIPGVAGAVQYTNPVPAAREAALAGKAGDLTTRDKHTRECWVVLEEGADPAAVREKIVTMEDYFADYDTTVNFISAEELARDHAAMPHGGSVIRSGYTQGGPGTNEPGQGSAGAGATDGGGAGKAVHHAMEFNLRLDSNPQFTGSVLTATARAVARLAGAGEVGARTLFDVPLGLLIPEGSSWAREHLL